MYNYPMMNGNDWGWGVFMMLLWLVFLIVIVVIVVRLLKGHEIGTSHKASPIDFAKERYAKGEINREQFEQLKKDLSK
jgi:putative membrane protein